MGIEDYRVSLRSRAAPAELVREWVRRQPNTTPDDGMLPHTRDYFRIDNGNHVLEVEVSKDDPAEVSVRFALCNPVSVEAAFLALVRELVTTFEMEFHDQEAAEADPWWRPPEQFDRFRESTLGAIPRRRSDWVTQFGPEQFPGGCDDAWQWVFERERASAKPVLVTTAG